MVKTKILQVNNDTMTIVVQTLDCRTVVISPPNEDVEIWDEKKEKLVGLNYYQELEIALGGVLALDKQKYKVRIIDKKDSDGAFGPGYYLYTQKLNKSSNFIAPFLGFTRGYYRWSKNFVNCYVGTEKYGDYGSSIYMLYRFDGSKEFQEFEARVENHPWYSETIDPDKHHVLYRFDIPDDSKFRRDIDKILRGEYSEISVAAKNQILKFHHSNPDRPLGQILNKSPQRRREMEVDLSTNKGGVRSLVSISKNAELFDRFQIEQEIFMNYYIIEDD